MNLLRKFLAVGLLLAATSALAVPAMRVKRTLKLSDGTLRTVQLCGDENMHFFLDEDNNAYADDGQGRLVRRDRQALVRQWKERLSQRNAHRIQKARERGMLDRVERSATDGRLGSLHRAKWGAEQNPVSGKKKGLVILVNFSDKKMATTHGQDFFNGYFNTVGFSEEGCKGSVHDYFQECSYGKFDLSFDVIGPVTVSKNMAYYGTNEYGADKYPGEMVSEACRLADAQGVDFSQYDWDNDGMVDQVFVLYAGYGESMGAPENTIWPHEATLTDCQPWGDGKGPIKFDGVTVDTYAVSCELLGSTGKSIAGIGTACHEFSHCMCLPDLYDPEGTFYGMDYWDLMDYGAYSGDNYGDCPTAFTSYERMYCGWLTPTELTQPTIISDMKALVDAPAAYIIYNEANRNEYYLLENRQQRGFNRYDPAHGMLVLHVNFSADTWVNNTVNATSQQCMTIIPADNILSQQTNSGDTWPGMSRNTSLTDTSKPAATLYTPNTDGRKLMGHGIEDIAEANGLISFTYDGGVKLEVPTALSATAVTSNGFTANWNPVTGVKGYEIQLTSTDLRDNSYPISSIALVEEDFSLCNNGTEKNGTVDISPNIDQYMHMAGWETKNAYTTPRDEMRIGNGKTSGGHIISPWLKSPSKTVTVAFTIRSYSTDQEPVYLTLAEGEETPQAVARIPVTKEPTLYVLTVTFDYEDWWFALDCDARFYVCSMNAYEGHVTEEQVEAGVISQMLTQTQLFQTADKSYAFTGLSSDKSYTYKVRAFTDNAHSAWSNEIKVELPLGTGIASPEDVQSALPRYTDLQGRVLDAAPRKGIYIKDGRKLIAR